MSLTERRAPGLSAEQEARITSLVREGRSLGAVRRLREAGGSDLKTACRYVRRLERRQRRSRARTGSRDLWWS